MFKKVASNEVQVDSGANFSNILKKALDVRHYASKGGYFKLVTINKSEAAGGR